MTFLLILLGIIFFDVLATMFIVWVISALFGLALSLKWILGIALIILLISSIFKRGSN